MYIEIGVGVLLLGVTAMEGLIKIDLVIGGIGYTRPYGLAIL